MQYIVNCSLRDLFSKEILHATYHIILISPDVCTTQPFYIKSLAEHYNKNIFYNMTIFSFLSRKCFHAAYYYLDDPPNHPSAPQVDWEVPVEIGGEIRAAVPVNEFAKHVASLHADGDIGFSREYEAIQCESAVDELPCEHSQHPENKRKNRYLNIIACKWNESI